MEAQRATSIPNIALLPVEGGDLPLKDVPNHALPQTLDVSASPAMSPSREIEIEIGERRIRIRGVSKEFAERYLPTQGFGFALGSKS
ncbi:hypothetical protein [Burkholderia sp. BCC0322]|uniref:hypothetical protein n=1 Tax=unclassified Burkholderia TaxID=2613784 RepID=UPI00158B3BCE|nr:hypothetical protein [Burkholderia sp. BCC0322]